MDPMLDPTSRARQRKSRQRRRLGRVLLKVEVDEFALVGALQRAGDRRNRPKLERIWEAYASLLRHFEIIERQGIARLGGFALAEMQRHAVGRGDAGDGLAAPLCGRDRLGDARLALAARLGWRRKDSGNVIQLLGTGAMIITIQCVPNPRGEFGGHPFRHSVLRMPGLDGVYLQPRIRRQRASIRR